VSVTLAITLPAQPATAAEGEVEYTPLGGDGFVAPFAMYTLKNLAVVNDASAGFANIVVTMDQRYTALVSYMTIDLHQVTSTNKEIRMAIGTGGSSAGRLVWQTKMFALRQEFAPEVSGTWVPPGVLMKGSGPQNNPNTNFIEWIANNDTSGDTLAAHGQILLFNLDVEQRTPLPIIMASRSTGGSQAPSLNVA